MQIVKVRRLRLSSFNGSQGLSPEMLTVTGLLQRRDSYEFPNDHEVGLAAMELGDRDTASPKGVYTEIGIQCELGDSTLARLLECPEKQKETVVDDKTPLLGESKQSASVASKLPCCAIM